MELLVGSGRTPRSSLSLADREESGVFAARAGIVPIAGGLLLPKSECTAFGLKSTTCIEVSRPASTIACCTSHDACTCERREFLVLRKSRHGHIQNQTRGSRLGSLYYENITTLTHTLATLPRQRH